MKTILAKTILTKNKYPHYWFGNDYNINLYRGCHHGCIYCDSRSECYQNDDFDTVKVKKDALIILQKELAKKRNKGVVGIGAMSDSYNLFENEMEITRGALKLLKDYHFGVSLETKSDLVTRDIDLFLDIQRYNDVIVKLSITTVDDQLSQIIEPHAPVSSLRFQALKKLSDAGIYTGILIHPILPFITDTEENIKAMVKRAHENGAKFIHAYFGVTLRDRQRDYFYQNLEYNFPGLKDKYMKCYGQHYQCFSKNRNHLEYIFKKECQKYGILYKMEDIIQAYKTKQTKTEQLSLF
ncbi:MAG: radical SAM protein [Coprobacillus sp.]|nr:radical SAM protein [Coprobacillus sp.]